MRLWHGPCLNRSVSGIMTLVMARSCSRIGRLQSSCTWSPGDADVVALARFLWLSGRSSKALSIVADAWGNRLGRKLARRTGASSWKGRICVRLTRNSHTTRFPSSIVGMVCSRS